MVIYAIKITVFSLTIKKVIVILNISLVLRAVNIRRSQHISQHYVAFEENILGDLRYRCTRR